jgi:site-specific DNA recombinase
MRSPDTQWRGIERTAQKFGVPVPPPERIFTDRDLSATDSNVVRLGYERMLKAIDSVAAKRYEVVVIAYAQDRVFRQPADWQHFTELVGMNNCDGRLITDFEGNVDLGAMGIFAAGAGYVEALKTAKRSKDGIGGAAMEGKGHGQVGYGWAREYDHSGGGKAKVTTVIVESEAAVIREIATRYLRGESIRAICRDLNARHIPAPGAGNIRRRDPVTREPLAFANDGWEPQKVRALLRRNANKGIRVHTSGKGARRTVEYFKAEWDAILDDDTFDTVVAKLSDPERRTVTSNTAKHLLSGIATCGKLIDGKPCGKVVRARVSYKGKARERYLAYGCEHNHVAKMVGPTENLVTTEVLHVLSQPEVRASLTPTPDTDTRDALAREAALLARKDAAADDYASGIIDRPMMARIAASIDGQLATIRQAISATQDTKVYGELLTSDPDSLETVWAGYTLDCQRSVVKALFDVVFIPNPRGVRPTFDPIRTIRIDLASFGPNAGRALTDERRVIG